MRLLYEWIKCDTHQVFNDEGINFTDDYDITYDSKNQVLSIKKKETCIPSNFYTINGTSVVKQVTCILGENGSGKTSLLKHIYKTDLHRVDNLKQYPNTNTIQVIEYGRKLNIYHNQTYVSVETELKYTLWDISKPETINEVFKEGNYANTTKIFISNDYFVSLNENRAQSGFQSKVAYTPYDISSIQSSFLDLITKQSNSLSVYRNLIYELNERLKNKPNPQFFQNVLYGLFLYNLNNNNKREDFKYFKNVRINFHRIDEADAYIDEFSIYKMMLNQFQDISIEDIIMDSFDKENLKKYFDRQDIILDYKLLKIFAIHSFVINNWNNKSKSIYANLKTNLITEILLSLTDYEFDICSLKNCNVESLFKTLQNEIENSREKLNFDTSILEIKNNELKYFKTANESIENLKDIIPNIENESEFLVDDNLQFLKYMNNEVESKKSFVLKYFWMNYAGSAGERACLNIFADIGSFSFFKNFSRPAKNGLNKNVILLLDEPDLYGHPEWQRKMLYEIIDTLEKLYKDYSFHIIFSTHSPLFLSDIPKENIVMLEKRNNGICVIREKGKQTFGANIFDLYNNSFLLDSFIGEFAQKKIEIIIKETALLYNQNVIVSQEKLDSFEKMIELIGEPILRNKLKTMLGKIGGRQKL